MKTAIPAAEIQFHPASFCDGRGRVFFWQDELYRAVDPAGAADCRRLFESGLVDRLVQRRLLVESEPTDMELEGYRLVVRHRRLPFVSYPFEWCFDMLQDAALAVADVEIELAREGLTLLDCNPWNVLFDLSDGPRPLYVDLLAFASVEPYRNTPWSEYGDYQRHYRYPLQLMSDGFDRVARWLLHDGDLAVLPREYAALTGRTPSTGGVRERVRQWISRLGRYVPDGCRPLARAARAATPVVAAVTDAQHEQFVLRARQEVAAIAPPPESSGLPPGPASLALTPSDAWEPKQHAVHRVLSTLHPATVLDAGAGNGWYAQLAAKLGSQAVAVDRDPAAIAACYREARQRQLPVLPLVMDLRYPSPGLGIGAVERPSALQRLKADLVLALGLVHELVFERSMGLEQIQRTLCPLVERWLLVEFVPREHPSVRRFGQETCHRWYTRENFVAWLDRAFATVQPLGPDSGDNGSELFLCGNTADAR